MGLRTRWTTAVAVAMVAGVVGAPPAHAGSFPPVAVPDTLSAVLGTQVVVNPLLNDTDADGESLALDPTLTLQSGTATVAVVGAGPDVAITPTTAERVVVGYTVVDSSGASASSTITVDVAPPAPPPNQAPVATPDVAQMYSGGQLAIDPRTNDSDPDADALTITSAAVSSGAGSVTTDGQLLTIGAAPGFVGLLVITYTVSDPRGGQSQATVTVDVIKAPNRPPVAVADAVSVKVGRTYRIAPVANDTDPDGDRLTLVKVGKVKHGTAKRSGSKVVYRAPKSWTGVTKVRYTVRDASGATSKGTLTITVERRAPAKPKPKPTPKPPAAGGTPSKAAVESALARLGLPTGSANGRYDDSTRRAVCAWRTITGRPAKRTLPSAAEARAIVATDGLPAPLGSMVTGVNVSVTCQAAFWVSGTRGYRRVMAATTGKPGYRTRLGIHRVFITHRVWRYSTIYPEARMYKPMQFSGGQAIHGSSTDRLVKTYPASHGCVRMLHRDVDALQAGGVGNGTAVRVFGAW